MTTVNDPDAFLKNNYISGTHRTRSSSRNRKVTLIDTDHNSKTRMPSKRTENISQIGRQRVVTRSSQKSPLVTNCDQNDSSFMPSIGSDFSQFVNDRKRARDERKTRAYKRPKTTTCTDENQPPTEDNRNIEIVRLTYEAAGSRTNLVRTATKNAQTVARRAPSNAVHRAATNETYNLNDNNRLLDDTQMDTTVIPDSLVNDDTQHNDSSWQRDIDRLMKKLEEPSIASKSQTQIAETQAEEDIFVPNSSSRTNESVRVPPQTMAHPKSCHQQQLIQTSTIIQTDEIGIQTERPQSSFSQHDCCQDVSSCPCVLRYSKLERLFMERMSQFINIVPTMPNARPSTIQCESYQRRRLFRNYSRFRRFRAGRRAPCETTRTTSISNEESKSTHETADESNAQTDGPAKETCEPIQEQSQPMPSETDADLVESIVPAAAADQPIKDSTNDLSSADKLDVTATVGHSSTIIISSTLSPCPNARRPVLTTSSLDEHQKSQFRSFVSRFGISISPGVDSSTTHVIVNDNPSLVCPLTGKIIQGIARHLFIVSHRWLSECLSQESIVDERPYEIRGDTSLGSDHGGMRRSRLTPSYLLDKYSICLRCSPGDCAPLQTIDQVQELVELCGAKLVQSFSEIKTIDHERQMVLVLGINGFAGGEKKRKALLETCQQFHVKCVNIHWLLISVAKFEVQPFEYYDINQV